MPSPVNPTTGASSASELQLARQLDRERAPRAPRGLDPNRAAMPLHHTSRDRQPQPAARIAALEALEQRGQALPPEAGPAVPGVDPGALPPKPHLGAARADAYCV